MSTYAIKIICPPYFLKMYFNLRFVLLCSKWRTTPVVEEVFAEVLAQVAAAGVVDAAEAVEGAAVPGVASPRTRK